MKVMRTVGSNVDMGIHHASLDTRYAFSGRAEAIVALGAVAVLIGNKFSSEGKGLFKPRFKDDQTMDIDAARDMQEAVGRRLIAFDAPSTAYRLDPFLTPEQSANLWHTIDWAASPSQREATVNPDGLSSVVAGALSLRKAILDAGYPAYNAGVTLLEARERTGLSRLRRPSLQLPEHIDSYYFAPGPKGGTQVTVIAENIQPLDATRL